MDFIKQVILGIFFPNMLDENDEEEGYELETTIEIYTGNAFDGGEVEDEKAYNKYFIS